MLSKKHRQIRKLENTLKCCLLPQSLHYTNVFYTGWDSGWNMRKCFPPSTNLALDGGIQNRFAHRCLTRCSLIILAVLKNLLIHFSLLEKHLKLMGGKSSTKSKWRIWNIARNWVSEVEQPIKRSNDMVIHMNNYLIISNFYPNFSTSKLLKINYVQYVNKRLAFSLQIT